MLNIALKGTEITPFFVQVDSGAVRKFAQAIGEKNLLHTDEAAAQAAGYPSVLVPPTYLFCLEMQGQKPMEVYELLHVDYAQVLHGEQHFVYHRPCFGGETLCFRPRIVDLYEKKCGTLGFIVWQTHVQTSSEMPVADLRSVMVVREAQTGRA